MVSATAISLSAAFLMPSVSAHGFLKTPRSRNIVAYQDQNWASYLGGHGASNDPEPEDCPHCLNRGGSLAQCGIYSVLSEEPIERNYDQPRNSRRLPMPPNVQGTYRQGDVIDVEVMVTTHHRGHFEFAVCPIENATPMPVPTPECFASNKLDFVSDESYGAPPDPAYPERAYIAPASVASWGNGDAYGEQPVVGAEYRMKFRLPRDVSGDVVLLQWYYLTANSCKHTGYDEYPFPEDWGNDVDFYPGLPDCESIPEDGNGVPEQFWNCAEIKVVASGDGSSGEDNASGFESEASITRPSRPGVPDQEVTRPSRPGDAVQEPMAEPLPTPPTRMPTQDPTSPIPTYQPTPRPTRQTRRPTGRPTPRPTRETKVPTRRPVPRPTRLPTRRPTSTARGPTNAPAASTAVLHKKNPAPTPSPVESEPSLAAFFQNAKPTRRPQRPPTSKPTPRPTKRPVSGGSPNSSSSNASVPSFTVLSPSEPYVVPVYGPGKGQEQRPSLGESISMQLANAKKPKRQKSQKQNQKENKRKKKRQEKKRQKRNKKKKKRKSK